jgi:hypothetical protein
VTEAATNILWNMTRLAKRVADCWNDRAIVNIVARLAVIRPTKVHVLSMWKTNKTLAVVVADDVC